MIASHTSTAKIGLALAGGGPEGAIYEIGAIRALDESIEGLDLNDLQIYVRVSAGAFIASCLANNLSTKMSRTSGFDVQSQPSRPMKRFPSRRAKYSGCAWPCSFGDT